MAVSISGGLVTPVLKDVCRRDVFTLARNWRRQVAAAQARDFAAAGLTGGTFYISNLGMSGIEQFDALLPQNVGCIMAVGSIRNVLVPAGRNTSGVEGKRQMNVTLTCDHRHIYGQHAADFLTVRLRLQNVFFSPQLVGSRNILRVDKSAHCIFDLLNSATSGFGFTHREGPERVAVCLSMWFTSRQCPGGTWFSGSLWRQSWRREKLISTRRNS